MSAEKDNASAFNGTRKLIRPRLPFTTGRREPVHTEDPLTHAGREVHAPTGRQSSHAEAFYFQKQVQQHTEMMVVMDDGEEISGTIEWYDKCVIKLKAGRQRVLIYKSGIRYLYKASEAHAGPGVMK